MSGLLFRTRVAVLWVAVAALAFLIGGLALVELRQPSSPRPERS